MAAYRPGLAAKELSRREQAEAIWKAIGLYTINKQFAGSVREVMGLAVLAFDDDAGLEAGSIADMEGWRPLIWAHVKGQLELAIEESGIGAKAQAEWRIALEAAYRLSGSADIVPNYDGIF